SHFTGVGGINPVNIGTYIANAAIGTLYFQDSVLIVPVVANGGAVSFNGNLNNFLCGNTVHIPNVGQGSQSVAMQWFIHLNGQNDNAKALHIVLRRRVS